MASRVTLLTGLSPISFLSLIDRAIFNSAFRVPQMNMLMGKITAWDAHSHASGLPVWLPRGALFPRLPAHALGPIERLLSLGYHTWATCNLSGMRRGSIGASEAHAGSSGEPHCRRGHPLLRGSRVRRPDARAVPSAPNLSIPIVQIFSNEESVNRSCLRGGLPFALEPLLGGASRKQKTTAAL